MGGGAAALLVVLAAPSPSAGAEAGPREPREGPPDRPPAAARDTNEIVELPRPEGASTGKGAISPAGTRYAYEVGPPDGSTQIWTLDLGTGDARPLTRGPGGRIAPAWSPSGDRIAFWHTSWGDTPELEGIWVVGAGGGDERPVFRPEDEVGFAHSPRWAGPDSIVFDYFRGNLTGGDETWIVGADGTGARRLEDPGRLAGRVPEGPRARFEPCCNLWRDGLWIEGAEEDDRCLVGPVGYGSALARAGDGGRILFTTRPEPREAPTLWHVEVDEGEARRVVGPDGRLLRSGDVRGIDGSADGVVTVRLETAPDPVRLWVIRDPASLTLSPPVVSGCRDRYPEVAAFAREHGFEGRLRIRSRLHVPGRGFEVVGVSTLQAGVGRRVREAVRAAGRVGWSGPPCRVGRFGDRSCPRDVPEEGRYRPPADASHLWSAPFLGRLREERWDRAWVEVLLRAPELPSAALDSLMEHGRFDDLLVEDPRVRGDVDRLVRIWGRRRPSDRVAGSAYDALWPRGPEVVARADVPRELLLHFARDARQRASGGGGGPSAAIGRRLLERPDAGRDPEVLVQLALMPPSADSTVFRAAGRRLLDHPSAPDAAIRRAAPNLAADPDLADRLFGDDRIRDHAGALRGLARTPWRDWSVAGRARRELERLRERRLDGREGVLHVPSAAVSSRGVARPGAGPGADPRLAATLLLPRIDPVTATTVSDSAFRAQRRADERALCRLAEGPDAEELDLRRLAEGAVYATSTRLATCLLESPVAREDPEVLEVLARMADLNDDPRLPGPDAPSIAEVRRRASELLRR